MKIFVGMILATGIILYVFAGSTWLLVAALVAMIGAVYLIRRFHRYRINKARENFFNNRAEAKQLLHKIETVRDERKGSFVAKISSLAERLAEFDRLTEDNALVNWFDELLAVNQLVSELFALQAEISSSDDINLEYKARATKLREQLQYPLSNDILDPKFLQSKKTYQAAMAMIGSDSDWNHIYDKFVEAQDLYEEYKRDALSQKSTKYLMN